MDTLLDEKKGCLKADKATLGRKGNLVPVGPVEVPRVAVTFVVGFVGKKKKNSDKLDLNENASHADSAGLDCLAVNG